MAELVVRLVFSLAVVLGLLLLMARVGSRRFRGRAGSAVTVLHRQPLSRGTTVTVVSVGSRVLVLGTTEQQVSILTELDPDELDQGDLLAPVTQLVPTAGDGDFADVLLHELDPDAGSASATPGRHAGARRRTPPARQRTTVADAGSGLLAGSVLSPQTWRAALQAVSGRAS